MTSPGSTKLPVGALVAAKYRITREIGRGGMASVYEARNVDIGKKVAIKVLAQELTSSAVIVERFLREARAAAAIRSPHICDVYDSGRLEDGRPFLVLELLEGESLYERMTRVRQMDAATVIDVITQVCRGLTRAHAGSIVHRDLKPENIFLTQDEDGKLLAKILDFGLAKFYVSEQGTGDAKQQRLTREGAVFGTPAYMSPEQVRGQGAVDLRADLWALACIVYECLTGQTVWATDQGVAMTFAQIAACKLPDPLKLRPMLPPNFIAWFKKGLSRDIADRFQTARELAEELAVSFNRGKPSFSAIHMLPQASEGEETQTDEREPPSGNEPDAKSKGKSDDKPQGRGAERGTAPSLEIPITMTEPPAAPSSARQTESTPTRPPPRPAGNSVRNAVVGVTLLGVLGTVAYVSYRRVEPSVALPGSASAQASGSAASSAAVPPVAPTSSEAVLSPPPAPTLPWQPGVAAAQEALLSGDHKTAAAQLRDARDKGGHGIPRTMLEHMDAFTKGGGPGQPCSLAGMARPRTYDIGSSAVRRVQAGRPVIVVGPSGPLMVWADAHEGPDHLYGALLDKYLRPTSTPIDLTPEATAAARPDLVRVGDRFVLAWLDMRGPTTGIFARFIDKNGTIDGKAVLVAPAKGSSTFHAFGTGPEGHFIAITAPREGDDTEDLFVRRLGPNLEPKSQLGRVTDVVANGPGRPRVRAPAIAPRAGSLFVSYRFEREPEKLASLLRIPTKEVPGQDVAWGLGPGVVPNVKSAKGDHYIGTMSVLNADRTKAELPQLACGPEMCFAAWSGEARGASGAFIDGQTGDPLWSKRFALLGERPGVGVSPRGEIAVAWYDQGRVSFARANRSGVGDPSRFARVSGDQPPPAVTAGASPGEWLIAWLDFEAGLLEPYAARVLCR